MVVAASDGCGECSVVEVKVGSVGAGDAAAGIPRVNAAAKASYHPSTDGPDDINLVRSLPPEDSPAWLRRQLLWGARTVQPVGKAPAVDHAELS